MYDKCVALWRDAKDYFQRAAILLGEDFKMPGMWQQFWAALPGATAGFIANAATAAK